MAARVAIFAPCFWITIQDPVNLVLYSHTSRPSGFGVSSDIPERNTAPSLEGVAFAPRKHYARRFKSGCSGTVMGIRLFWIPTATSFSLTRIVAFFLVHCRTEEIAIFRSAQLPAG